MIVRVIVDGVLGVTVDVHIGHGEVLVIVVIYVAIFVVIFCNWRCTLYNKPGTTIGTKFSVLQIIRIPSLMRCGF